MAAVVAAVALFVSFSAAAGAQNRGGSVSGTVKDANGPVIGAAVFVKGGSTGETTDIDGKFKLSNLKTNDVITVSIIGYETKEIVWNGQATLDIVILEEATALKGVVVTAMGMVRQSESLTYAAETVGGKDVNDIKSINMINSLQGKSAGLVITPNSTGAGGSSKILFRGNKSINGSNQPLIVVDGVPVMQNITSSQVASNYGGERDGGDVMSTINPDDIKSITLLKGASAAALYGAVAANGAIMITTKSAAAGKVNVTVSSNTTAEALWCFLSSRTTTECRTTAPTAGAASSPQRRRTISRSSSAQVSRPTTHSQCPAETTLSEPTSPTAMSTQRA